MSGNDNDVGLLADVMRGRAMNDGRTLYVVGREGLDLIRPKGYTMDQYDLIYMSPGQCLFKEGAQQYRFKPVLTQDPEFGADLLDAPDLVDTPETRAVIDGLLTIQTEQVVSRLLGWYSACFMRQIFHDACRQFPLNHSWGESGTGKTATNTLFAQLHTYTVPPKELLFSSTTAVGVKVAMASSASIPLILDEWKPKSDGGAGKTQQIRGFMRGAYNQASTSQGTRDPGAGEKDMRKSTFSAPLVFISEALETETAIILRSLVTPFKVVAAETRRDVFNLVKANRHVISGLGKVLLDLARTAQPAALRSWVEWYEVNEVIPRLNKKTVNTERPIYNFAVTLVGLDLAKRALARVFIKETVIVEGKEKVIGHYDDAIENLKQALLESIAVEGLSNSAISEVSKVLSVFAQLSNEREDPRTALVHHQDYVVGEGYVEIKPKQAFSKYAKWTRATGAEKLFESEEAFVAACSNYPAVVDRVCADSILKTGPFTVVYRFSNERLDADQIETFKGRKD